MAYKKDCGFDPPERTNEAHPKSVTKIRTTSPRVYFFQGLLLGFFLGFLCAGEQNATRNFQSMLRRADQPIQVSLSVQNPEHPPATVSSIISSDTKEQSKKENNGESLSSLTNPFAKDTPESETPKEDKNTKEDNNAKDEESTKKGSDNLKETIHNYLHQHPDRLKICDTQKLAFDESKMVGRIDETQPLIFNHSLHLAYGPRITKTGSTSAKGTLKDILSVTNKHHITDPKDFDPYDNYDYYAFVRHPLQRFLAGFHQVEVFWRMNWFDATIKKFDLQFWDKFCTLQEGSKFTVLSKSYQCTGSEPKQDILTRLGRLHAFMDDIDRVGFFDQHIMPISYQLKINVLYKELKTEETQPVVFDIASMTGVHDSLMNIVQGRNLTAGEKFVKMNRNKSNSMNPLMPWVVSLDELTTIANSMHNQTDVAATDDLLVVRNQEINLAKDIIEKMCRLFENDVRCLPYDIPECQF